MKLSIIVLHISCFLYLFKIDSKSCPKWPNFGNFCKMTGFWPGFFRTVKKDRARAGPGPGFDRVFFSSILENFWKNPARPGARAGPVDNSGVDTIRWFDGSYHVGAAAAPYHAMVGRYDPVSLLQFVCFSPYFKSCKFLKNIFIFCWQKHVSGKNTYPGYVFFPVRFGNVFHSNRLVVEKVWHAVYFWNLAV